MLLLAAWCGLRFGELTELRRKDLDLDRGIVNVRRAVTRVDGQFIVTSPKSAAGRRTVALPPHLIPALQTHLDRYTAINSEALLFPATGDPTRHLAPASLYKSFYRARKLADRPDLRWHDLRHTGAVLAAPTTNRGVEFGANLVRPEPGGQESLRALMGMTVIPASARWLC
jgi:integrase